MILVKMLIRFFKTRRPYTALLLKPTGIEREIISWQFLVDAWKLTSSLPGGGLSIMLSIVV